MVAYVLICIPQNIFPAPVSTTKTQPAPFAIIGRFSVNDSWSGAQLVLQTNDSANMPQTPSGSMIFTYQDVAAQNNPGTIALTSGGAPPTFYHAPALSNQPSLVVNNWQANNLRITNVSANSATPISIQAVGPGIPGTTPLPLPVGSPLALGPGQTAQTNAPPQWMQLVIQCNASELGVFGLIGGPADARGSNAYVVEVNAPSNTPPDGFYAATTANAYTFQFNWGSSVVFVANLSGSTSSCGQIILRQL